MNVDNSIDLAIVHDEFSQDKELTGVKVISFSVDHDKKTLQADILFKWKTTTRRDRYRNYNYDQIMEMATVMEQDYQEYATKYS